jgi:hypothetical protein
MTKDRTPLQNSDIKGQRYLNDKSRLEYEHGKRSGEFLDRVRKMNEEVAEQRRLKREQHGSELTKDPVSGS